MFKQQQINPWVAYATLIAISLATIFIFSLITSSMNKENEFAASAVSAVNHSVSGVVIQTNKGSIEIDFYPDKAPMTVNNFIKLVDSGFYDGTKFHRVIPNFMIQGGDPLTKDDSMKSKWGTGGPGYTFDDEIGKDNRNLIGTISMANAGPNTNGSQFFINVADNDFLDTKHTVFGKVTKGMDVVEKISEVKTELNSSGEKSLPVDDVVIERIVLK